MKFTKDMIGKTILGIPTGNNRNRHKDVSEQKVVEFEIKAIGRRYVSLLRKGWRQPEKYCMESGATESAVRGGFSLNAGFVFLQDWDEYEAYIAHCKRADSVRKYIRNLTYRHMRPEEIDGIYEVINRLGLADEEVV